MLHHAGQAVPVLAADASEVHQARQGHPGLDVEADAGGEGLEAVAQSVGARGNLGHAPGRRFDASHAPATANRGSAGVQKMPTLAGGCGPNWPVVSEPYSMNGNCARRDGQRQRAPEPAIDPDQPEGTRVRVVPNSTMATPCQPIARSSLGLPAGRAPPPHSRANRCRRPSAVPHAAGGAGRRTALPLVGDDFNPDAFPREGIPAKPPGQTARCASRALQFSRRLRA